MTKKKCVLPITWVISLCQHYGDSRGQTATMGVMNGSEDIPLNAIRSCRMELSPSEALDISTSLHLTIAYLLRIEWKDLKSKSYNWLVKIRG